MSGVEVVPADIVDATVKACKRAAQENRPSTSACWDLEYSKILQEAQEIANRRGPRRPE